MVKNSPANVGDTRDMGLIPGLRRSPEKERATHSSILAWRIPMWRRAWRAIVHEVTDMTEHKCYSICGPLKYSDFHIF